MPDAPTSSTAAIAERVRSLRISRGWSARQLAEECQERGLDLSREAIAWLETGRRQAISVDELMTFARVLDVAPVHLLVPFSHEGLVAVTPNEQAPAASVRAWVRGDAPLPGGDPMEYYRNVPSAEWESRKAVLEAAALAGPSERSRAAIATLVNEGDLPVEFPEKG